MDLNSVLLGELVIKKEDLEKDFYVKIELEKEKFREYVENGKFVGLMESMFYVSAPLVYKSFLDQVLDYNVEKGEVWVINGYSNLKNNKNSSTRYSSIGTGVMLYETETEKKVAWVELERNDALCECGTINSVKITLERQKKYDNNYSDLFNKRPNIKQGFGLTGIDIRNGPYFESYKTRPKPNDLIIPNTFGLWIRDGEKLLSSRDDGKDDFPYGEVITPINFSLDSQINFGSLLKLLEKVEEEKRKSKDRLGRVKSDFKDLLKDLAEGYAGKV